MKLCYKLNISYLKDILKEQLYRMGSSRFHKLFFGAENLSGILSLSRRGLGTRTAEAPSPPPKSRWEGRWMEFMNMF